MPRPTASLSLDLDNSWVYLKTRGATDWEQAPSYLPTMVPLVLDLLDRRGLKITFFIIGRDAAAAENRESLEQIVRAGHELGNHSYQHEPWIQHREKEQVACELKQAHRAIQDATGQKPVGYRGPGYSHSAATLEAVKELGYDFDTSILPSIIGPLARLYYFWTSGLTREERHTRRGLFGSLGDGMLPLRPFEWLTPAGGLLEIPVTTIPLLRIPFHPSYILWLSRRSRWIAETYMRCGLQMCRLWGVGPSVILHPLDFLGSDDVSGLSFFPGMDLPRQHKLDLIDRYLEEMQRRFDVVPMSEHARRIRASSASLKSVKTS